MCETTNQQTNMMTPYALVVVALLAKVRGALLAKVSGAPTRAAGRRLACRTALARRPLLDRPSQYRHIDLLCGGGRLVLCPCLMLPASCGPQGTAAQDCTGTRVTVTGIPMDNYCIECVRRAGTACPVLQAVFRGSFRARL